MAQIQTQEQSQQQKQGQTFSHLQLLQASLVELPVTQLVDRINTEMNDNPALETESSYDSADGSDYADYQGGGDSTDDTDDFETRSEREERQSALDEALGSSFVEEREEMVYGATESFYDQLKSQLVELEMTDRQRDIMEYLIGSLEDDGLLRKSPDAICEELAIYHNIDASVKEIEQTLAMLQTFDPAGIGARNLQECLLLQIDRRPDSRVKTLMARVVNDYFEAFTRKHWDKIPSRLQPSSTNCAS